MAKPTIIDRKTFPERLVPWRFALAASAVYALDRRNRGPGIARYAQRKRESSPRSPAATAFQSLFIAPGSQPFFGRPVFFRPARDPGMKRPARHPEVQLDGGRNRRRVNLGR